MIAKAHPELQLIPCVPCIAPFCQFIAERGIVLRPAQLVRLDCIVKGADSAVRPCQAALGWLVKRPEVGRVNGKNPAVTLDQYVAGIRCRFRDDGNAVVTAGSHRG